MDKVTLVRREVSASQWAKKIGECRSSGLSVTAWCSKNGINIKTYYYHLRKLREKICEQIPVAVTTLSGQTRNSAVVVTVSDACGLTVGISDGASAQTIAAVIAALKC